MGDEGGGRRQMGYGIGWHRDQDGEGLRERARHSHCDRQTGRRRATRRKGRQEELEKKGANWCLLVLLAKVLPLLAACASRG